MRSLHCMLTEVIQHFVHRWTYNHYCTAQNGGLIQEGMSKLHTLYTSCPAGPVARRRQRIRRHVSGRRRTMAGSVSTCTPPNSTSNMQWTHQFIHWCNWVALVYLFYCCTKLVNDYFWAVALSLDCVYTIALCNLHPNFIISLLEYISCFIVGIIICYIEGYKRPV